MTNPTEGVNADANEYEKAQYILGILGQDEQQVEETDSTEVEEVEATEDTTEEEFSDEESEEESEEDGTEEEESEEPVYTVKVDGEEVEVNLSELINGYSREADYRRKTQKLSDERKAYEAEQQKLAQEAQRSQEAIQQALEYAQNFDPIIANAKKIDWAKLAEDDPVAYTREQAKLNARLSEINTMWEEHQKLQSEQVKKQQESYKQWIENEVNATFETIPEWNDKEVLSREQKELTTFLANNNFKEVEIQGLIDHRMVNIARKAMLWDKHEASKDSAKEKRVAKPASKTLKAKSTPSKKSVKTSKQKQLLAQAKKSGKDADIVNAILANLENN